MESLSWIRVGSYESAMKTLASETSTHFINDAFVERFGFIGILIDSCRPTIVCSQ
jgi:cell division protein FtsW (lipid II flippase)